MPGYDAIDLRMSRYVPQIPQNSTPAPPTSNDCLVYKSGLLDQTTPGLVWSKNPDDVSTNCVERPTWELVAYFLPGYHNPGMVDESTQIKVGVEKQSPRASDSICPGGCHRLGAVLALIFKTDSDNRKESKSEIGFVIEIELLRCRRSRDHSCARASGKAGGSR
ncbi:hypothetical protein EVAR_86811_1 [Eumeta japonica]|uniref:Uncharacterized protein n=1 Tax=Eumeta variegata TaxID=151549 RepID=A0A4C1VT21_EUMVA|nr:hypothetical protein EVAR_86811_1 [Eumeta japonica]